MAEKMSIVGREEETLFSRDENDVLVRREAATREQFGTIVTVIIDGYRVNVPKAVPQTDAQGHERRDADGELIPRNSTIYDAAMVLVANRTWTQNDLADRIPTLCHMNHLDPVGVCRMCVVQIEQIKRGKPRTERKLLPACHHLVADNMVVTTRAGWDGYCEENRVADTARRPDLPDVAAKFATNIRDCTRSLTELLMIDHHKPALGKSQRYENELEQVATRLEVTADAAQRRPSLIEKHARSRNRPRPQQRPHPLPMIETTIRPEESGRREVRDAWLDWNKEIDAQLPYSSRTVVVDHDRCILCDRCVRSCSQVRPFQVIGHTGKGYATRISFDLDLPMSASSCVQCGECMTACPTGALSVRQRVRPRAWDDSPAIIPQNPNESFPAASGFLTAAEIRGITVTYSSPSSGTQLLQPFRSVPFAYLKWNEGAVRKWVVKAGERRRLCIQGEYASTAFLTEGGGQFEITRREPASENASPGFFGRLFGRANSKSTEPAERLIRTASGTELVLGEMACLTFQRRTASVIAVAPGTEDIVVYEITRNLLDMMRRSAETRRYVEEMYTFRAIEDCVSTGRIFAKLAAEQRAAAVRFLLESPGVELRLLDADQLVVVEGERASHFYIVRHGSLKVFEALEGVERTIRVLRDRDYFGELAIIENTRRAKSVRSLDPSEIVLIPATVLRSLCEQFPVIQQQILNRDYKPESPNVSTTGLFEQYVEQGLYQGQKLLALDLTCCTRCDECTRACADSHDGNARLLREGLRFGDFLIATSCRSCRTPYCMDGCPVDAIHRKGDRLEVMIADHCIGCGLCERNCPYGSIHMTARDVPNAAAANFANGHPGLIASGPRQAVNCDLCNGGTPYCVHACPHDAAHRMTGDELLTTMTKRRTLL